MLRLMDTPQTPSLARRNRFTPYVLKEQGVVIYQGYFGRVFKRPNPPLLAFNDVAPASREGLEPSLSSTSSSRGLAGFGRPTYRAACFPSLFNQALTHLTRLFYLGVTKRTRS